MNDLKTSIPFVLCVTGGIGSGKSVVCRILNSMGVPVYNADKRARDLYAERPDLTGLVANSFGSDVLGESGAIDRAKLAKAVFGNQEKLQELNAIVHPFVRDDFQAWIIRQRGTPVICREAAILFESGASAGCDLIANVVAPEGLRLRRVVARDQVNESEVAVRMRHQWSDEQRSSQSDVIIRNDEKLPLLPQVWSLHQLSKALSAKSTR